MGWEKGKYYTRSKKVKGKVVREYIGGGEFAYLISEMDRIEQQEWEEKWATMRTEREEDRKREKSITGYFTSINDVLTEALIAAGYHKHKGQWRRKRGTKETSS